jgi:hypothetical protein
MITRRTHREGGALKNSESPGKEKFTGDKKGILFYIDCPCNCGRAIRMVLPSAKPVEDYNIPKIGNKFWQRLVNEKGLEEAIEFLHENA